MRPLATRNGWTVAQAAGDFDDDRVPPAWLISWKLTSCGSLEIESKPGRRRGVPSPDRAHLLRYAVAY